MSTIPAVVGQSANNFDLEPAKGLKRHLPDILPLVQCREASFSVVHGQKSHSS